MLGGVVVLCGLAWAYLFVEAAGMSDMVDMAGMAGMAMDSGWTFTEWSYLCAMWFVMMIAMMVPSALPTILVVARVDSSRRERREAEGETRGHGVLPLFLAGYLTVWGAYSLVAASAQWALHGLLLVSDAMVSASPLLSGTLLVAAGVFQFTGLKERCVSHCRSPLSFLTSHWREGVVGAFRMGTHHGTYCVGCCWALMALLFVLGVMNLLWVAALAILVLLEKTLPAGKLITRGSGVALLAWGVVVLARSLPGSPFA